MSTNHTEHYNLSQWTPEDKVLHTDFNEDNATIDKTLSELAGTLDKKADAADLAALTKRVGFRNCKADNYAYTGNGSTNRLLILGAQPQIVFIMGDTHFLCGVNGASKAISISSTGTVKMPSAAWTSDSVTFTSSDTACICNTDDAHYHVLELAEIIN